MSSKPHDLPKEDFDRDGLCVPSREALFGLWDLLWEWFLKFFLLLPALLEFFPWEFFLCMSIEIWSMKTFSWLCSTWYLTSLSLSTLQLYNSTLRLIIVLEIFGGLTWFLCPLNSIFAFPTYTFPTMTSYSNS